MKNRIHLAIATLISGLLIIASCQKQNSNPLKEVSKPYEFINGMVKFTSFDSYRAFLESESQKKVFLQDVLNNESYTSYAESHPASPASLMLRIPDPNEDVEDILSSPMLSGLVNDDNIVQIGDYLFKLDYDSAKVYVIHSLNQRTSYQKLLDKNAIGTDVFLFTTDDDILDILEDNNFPVNEAYDGESESLFKKCKENGAPERKDKGTETGHYTDCKSGDYSAHGDMHLKVVYQKAGFYFSLHLKSILQYWCDGATGYQNNATNGANSYIHYKPKCKDEVGPYIDDTEIIGAILSRRPYEGGRGLTKFHYRVQFRYKGPTEFGQAPGTYFYPRIYEVRYGY